MLWNSSPFHDPTLTPWRGALISQLYSSSEPSSFLQGKTCAESEIDGADNAPLPACDRRVAPQPRTDRAGADRNERGEGRAHHDKDKSQRRELEDGRASRLNELRQKGKEEQSRLRVEHRKRRENGIPKMGSKEVTETYEKIVTKKAELYSI